MAFRNITQVKAANKAGGYFWFSPDTVRFFNSRVESRVKGGHYWVESIQGDADWPRQYRIAIVDDDGSIRWRADADHTPVEYRSKRAALTALDDLVAALPVVVAGA